MSTLAAPVAVAEAQPVEADKLRAGQAVRLHDPVPHLFVIPAYNEEENLPASWQISRRGRRCSPPAVGSSSSTTARRTAP